MSVPGKGGRPKVLGVCWCGATFDRYRTIAGRKRGTPRKFCCREHFWDRPKSDCPDPSVESPGTTEP